MNPSATTTRCSYSKSLQHALLRRSYCSTSHRLPSPKLGTACVGIGILRNFHHDGKQQRFFDRSLYLHRQMTTTASSTSNKVGFVGLGNMGLPMCINLVRNEQKNKSNGDEATTATTTNTATTMRDSPPPPAPTSNVIAYDMNATAMERAEMEGAQTASNIEEIITSGCNVIFTMLPDDKSVSSVIGTMLQAHESLPSDKKNNNGMIFVDCSTVSPMTSRSLSSQIASYNPSFVLLDAPVSGGVRGAQDATLTFIVGCDSYDALETVGVYLNRMGKNVIHCGGSGTGSATKLCNNLALATQMMGVCEAMNLGDALGVDPVVLASVMNVSTGRCWSSEINNPHPVVAKAKAECSGGAITPASRDYEGGFGTKLMLKDLSLAVQAGQEMGVALPTGVLSKEMYRMADLRGLGKKDFGVMLQFLKGK